MFKDSAPKRPMAPDARTPTEPATVFIGAGMSSSIPVIHSRLSYQSFVTGRAPSASSF